MYACRYISVYVCKYVCMHVCMYVYMYVCIYVCMYAYMYVCTFDWCSNICLVLYSRDVMLPIQAVPCLTFKKSSFFSHSTPAVVILS